MPKRTWSNEDNQCMRDNYSILGPKGMVKMMNRSYSRIVNQANKLGLNYNGHRVYYNKDFFSIPTIQNSYWAGFIAADGCIDSKRESSVSIGLATKDIPHLEILKNHTNYTGNIKINGPRSCDHLRPGTFDSGIGYLNFYGAQQWVADLKKYWNIGPKKTFKLTGPNINDYNLSLAYIIGLIDGDGCLGRYIKNNGKYTNVILHLVGTYELLDWVKSILDQIAPYVNTESKVVNKSSIFKLAYHGARAVRIVDRLLELDIPYKMSRKWTKFDGIPRSFNKGGRLIYG